LYCEEDLEDTFIPAGFTIAEKPAALFGGREYGALVGWRRIWQRKSPSRKTHELQTSEAE
jgi:hypothetical protein